MPEPVLVTVFEFLSFEKQCFHSDAQNNEVQVISRKKAAFERLKNIQAQLILKSIGKENCNLQFRRKTF